MEAWKRPVEILKNELRHAMCASRRPRQCVEAIGVLRRMLALTELKCSNSMIEAWWRSLKHQWLFLHSLDSVTTVRRLVTFYVDEHNRVLPHSAFRGQTPDEMYFGTGDAVPADLTSRAAASRRARVEANGSADCETCPSVEAAA